MNILVIMWLSSLKKMYAKEMNKKEFWIVRSGNDLVSGQANEEQMMKK